MVKNRVTVGLCVKNGENLVGQAISSIIDQDFPHELMEVIFVDDGSQDRTLAIMNSYAPKLKMKCMVFHHDWKGLGYSRNVVVNNANGEYIIWVDSDTTLSTHFVRKQVEFMDNNLNVAIGKGRCGQSATTSLVAYLQNVEFSVEHLESKEKRANEPLGTAGAIYRVEAIKKIGGFNEKITGAGEDLDVEHKIRGCGWLLKNTEVEFYEKPRSDWKSLWDEYYWYGSGGRKVFNKINPHLMLYRMFPPAILLIVFSRTCRLTGKKVVLLLPLQWVFKRIAWCLGFALKRD
jgi:glycosyltransferase involved in cell wall biosynthesis